MVATIEIGTTVKRSAYAGSYRVGKVIAENNGRMQVLWTESWNIPGTFGDSSRNVKFKPSGEPAWKSSTPLNVKTWCAADSLEVV